MNDHMNEAERLLAEHEQAAGLCSYADCQTTRAALLAHIQRGAVPEGWQLDGSEVALLHHLISPDDDGEHPPITLRAGNVRMDDGTVKFGLLCEYTDYPDEGATLLVEGQPTAPAPDHFRDAGEMVSDTEDNGFGLLHDRPHTEMPGCRGAKSLKVRASADEPCDVVGHCVAETHCKTACKLRSSAPAGVPMPKPVAYGFGNTAITGHTNRLMMVRIDIPGGDQYAGAFWLPLVLADEAHTYGVACRAAGEAAGYTRGLRDAVRDAEIEALRLYVRALCKAVDAATDFAGTVAGGASWWDDVWADHAAALDRARERISQAALRGEVKP